MEAFIKDFDFNTFEAQWGKLSQEKRAIVVEQAGRLDPDLAILPVLAGIRSYHFSVRNAAAKNLGIIQSKITRLLSDPKDASEFHKGMKSSASVCARIYAHIRPDMPVKERNYFFKTLIQIEGKGVCFALKALYKGLVSETGMEKMICTAPEPRRLDFVDEYLQTSPNLRLKFGFSFKRILQSIKTREPVVNFFSRLFDRQRDADPFLNNIHPDLRDPDQIISQELQSPSPDIRIAGLKALAMTVPEISSDLLLDILAMETNEAVRTAVYHIVENASVGTYSKLFYPILELCGTEETKEGFSAFKALVVAGLLPPCKVLEMVRNNYPALMPAMKAEISTLSKISFLIIQDIALNKEKYVKSNYDVNLACVLGMIKKRPERVVKILKKYDDHPRDSVRMDVTRFMAKTKQVLAREKKDIETEFNPIVQWIKEKSEVSKGLMQTFFSSSTEKKIQALQAKNRSTPGESRRIPEFKDECIKDLDLSSAVFLEGSLFFSHCIINNCDFSRASFFNTCFNQSFFYNINMAEARFDSVNFDGAVFINVDARQAEFENCSFQNASIFNCNFNQARVKDASFLSASLSKTSFKQTDLSGSSFAYSKISAVSFTASNIDQADFSGVAARFSRFPSKETGEVKTCDIDYNARKFQLSFKDMPQMDETIVARINLLIFTEFIHYGRHKFLKQNQLSLLTAFDIFKKKQADLFQIIPFLLHENIDFPGMEKLSPETPHGICDYIPSRETQEILAGYIQQKKPAARRCDPSAVEGLFTIGSTGSLAQTSDSDIDYWVCINEENLSPRQIQLLKTKLGMLETIAGERFGTMVTFFLVDILKAKNNDFGGSSVESSGSAQARLLKEEFYRTMIYIAGKIPLWAVLPTPISVNYYTSILNNVSSAPDLAGYIDLGDIHAIPASEYFGASIWQMFKWLKSPFKSVIKMALLEKYIFEYGKEPLLCNKYKDEWMNSGSQLKLAQNDSYYILLKNLVRYFGDARDKRSVNLLLTCFFLKLGISKDSRIENTVFGLRKILLEKCMLEWGWTEDRVFEIGSFKTWQYHHIVKLSNTIERYMIQKYKTVNKSLEGLFHGRSNISPEDRTVLGRKILIEFSKQPGKVEKVLLISRSNRHFQGLHLKYNPGAGKTGTWELLNKNARAFHGELEPLIRAGTIEEIGAWLMNNGLYNETAVISLVPNPTYVTFDDIRKLFQAMYDFFSPMLKQAVGFDRLLMKNRVVCLFVSINFYAPKQQQRVTEYTAVYMNSWGEMFCKSFCSDQGFSTMEAAKTDILARMGIKKLPLNTAFYFSKGVAR